MQLSWPRQRLVLPAKGEELTARREERALHAHTRISLQSIGDGRLTTTPISSKVQWDENSHEKLVPW